MYDKILVAVDHSEISDRALLAARDLALLSKGEVWVLHLREREIAVKTGMAMTDETESEANAKVSAAVDKLAEAGVKAHGVPVLMAAAHQRRGDHEVCNIPVAGNRDIADHRDAEQCLDVWVMRMWLQRIPEEHQQIDLALGDTGADLLVTAVRAAPEAGDR